MKTELSEGRHAAVESRCVHAVHAQGRHAAQEIGEIAIIAGVSTHVINVDRASNAAVEIIGVDIGIDARLLIKATAHKQVQIVIFIPGAIHEGEYADRKSDGEGKKV